MGLRRFDSASLLRRAPGSNYLSSAPLAAAAATVGGTSGVSLTPGSSINDQTQTLPAPSDTAAVDPFFAAVGEVDQQLWLLSSSLGTHHTAANGELDGLPGGM